MPVSKVGKLYFTDEQYHIARYQCSALEYAKASGYPLVRAGHYYTLKDHDSFVFNKDGMWFWNSQNRKGGAIEFVMLMEHRSLAEAVLKLSGECNFGQTIAAPKTDTNTYRKKVNTEDKQPFELPKKSGNFKRLFAYLCKSRGLDKDIVQELVQQHRIYESVKTFAKDGKNSEIHNAVFVSYNENGKAVAAFQRGTASIGKPFKGDVPGSDKENYGWFIPGHANSTCLCIFEASIDAISHATLAKLDGKDYKDAHRIAIGGNVNLNPVMRYLKAHPEIKSIHVCLDNDIGGKKGVQAFTAAFREAGYTKDNGYHAVSENLPEHIKDFNELLATRLAAKKEAETQQSEEPALEMA